MFGQEIDNLIKITLVTFLGSVCIMPIMKRIANHIGAIDKPRDDEDHRHIHDHPIPKLGGLGIFLSFLLGYILFGIQSTQMNSVLIGSFIIILTSLIDDVKPIRASHKFLGHLVAACVLVFYGNFLLNNITAFGFSFDFGIWSYPITIFFIVACTNIINLIDGLDGLSAGVSSIFYLTIGIIGYLQGRSGSLVMILTCLMLGATLGFLVHNFHPAKIFAGDGATFMGFTISVITLLEFKGPALISFFIPLMILAIPILDTLFAIIRRLLKHQPIFSADRQHLHHQLLGMNFSHRTTVLIIYLIDLCFAIASIIYTIKDPVIGRAIYIVLFILVFWFVLHTSIISDKGSQKIKELESGVKEKLTPTRYKERKRNAKKGNQRKGSSK